MPDDEPPDRIISLFIPEVIRRKGRDCYYSSNLCVTAQSVRNVVALTLYVMKGRGEFLYSEAPAVSFSLQMLVLEET